MSYLPFITLLLPPSLKTSLRTEILVINKPNRSMNQSLCIRTGKIHREAHSQFTFEIPASANVCQHLILNNVMFLLFNMILGLFCCLFSQSQNHSNTVFLCPFYLLLKPHNSFPEMHIQFYYSIHSTWPLCTAVNFSHNALINWKERKI